MYLVKTCKKIQEGETRRGYMRKKMQYTYVEKRGKLFCDDYFFFCVNMFVTQISDISLQFSLLNSKSTKQTKKNPPIIMEGKQSIVRDGAGRFLFFCQKWVCNVKYTLQASHCRDLRAWKRIGSLFIPFLLLQLYGALLTLPRKSYLFVHLSNLR